MKNKIWKVVIHGETFYRTCISARGAKVRKYKTAKNRDELVNFLSLRETFKKKDTSGFLADSYSLEQLADIAAAMKILPQGQSLAEIVKKNAIPPSKCPISNALRDFKANKEKKNISAEYAVHLNGYLDAFAADFDSFEKATPQALISWILDRKGKDKSSPASPKTIRHYFGAISDFFDFAIRKEFIASNPFDKLCQDDLPKDIFTPAEFLTISQTREFFKMISKNYPQFLKFYAIAMFAGVRVAEIERLRPDDIETINHRIFIRPEISKTKRGEILEDFEPNVWIWLDALKNSPIRRPANSVRTRFSKRLSFKLPHNFARHSFATYHFSLYLDARRTCAITRHSEAMLKKHYLGNRVPAETARKYFEIVP